MPGRHYRNFDAIKESLDIVLDLRGGKSIAVKNPKIAMAFDVIANTKKNFKELSEKHHKHPILSQVLPQVENIDEVWLLEGMAHYSRLVGWSIKENYALMRLYIATHDVQYLFKAVALRLEMPNPPLGYIHKEIESIDVLLDALKREYCRSSDDDVAKQNQIDKYNIVLGRKKMDLMRCRWQGQRLQSRNPAPLPEFDESERGIASQQEYDGYDGSDNDASPEVPQPIQQAESRYRNDPYGCGQHFFTPARKLPEPPAPVGDDELSFEGM